MINLREPGLATSALRFGNIRTEISTRQGPMSRWVSLYHALRESLIKLGRVLMEVL